MCTNRDYLTRRLPILENLCHYKQQLILIKWMLTMKWNFRHTLFSAAVLTCASVCYPANAHTIYGLEQASHFEGTSSHPFYIQTESFLSHSRAKRYKNLLKSKLAYPIKMVHKHHYYTVTIGPIQTAKLVRKTASQILPISTMQPTLRDKIAAPYTKTLHDEYPTSAIATRPANWFVAVGVGVEHPQFGSSMSVNNGSDAPSPYDQDIYSTHRRTEAVIDISAGRRWKRDHKWIPAYSFGLAYQRLFPTNVGGTVMQYSSPDFVNYTYQSSVSSDLFEAFTKLNLFNYRFLSPFITAGAGCALNRSSGYSETALANVTARQNPNFASKTTSNFAYTLGAGIDFNVSNRLAISVDYKYLNLGKVTSGSGAGTWIKQLDLGSLKVNEVLINATYFIGQ
jgi:opacity protein-like surface antigen